MAGLLVLDNYDSFTYNLVHLLRELGRNNLVVARNDKISLDAVADFEEIVLSPGPGLPNEASIMPQLIKSYGATKRILGICLGHQCIGEVFGAKLRNLAQVVHAKAPLAKVVDSSEPVFAGLTPSFQSGRYHSWVVERAGFPDCLKITAEDELGEIMALRHRSFDVVGLQFHPESVLTPLGPQMLKNWLTSR